MSENEISYITSNTSSNFFSNFPNTDSYYYNNNDYFDNCGNERNDCLFFNENTNTPNTPKLILTNDANLFQIQFSNMYSNSFDCQDSSLENDIMLNENSSKTESENTKESSKGQALSTYSDKNSFNSLEKFTCRKRKRFSEASEESYSDSEVKTVKTKKRPKKEKERKTEKKFKRYDEAFKGLKSSVFSSLVSDKIKENENKSKSLKFWSIKKNILKCLRAYFTIDVKKQNNKKYYNCSTKEIITQIYKEHLPNLKTATEEEISCLVSGESIKKPRKANSNVSKLQANLFTINDSLNLVNIDSLNWEATFSAASLEILNKTYQQNIEKYKTSEYYEKYLNNLESYQTEEYIKNFNNILFKFEEYLEYKKLTKELFNKKKY